MPNRPPLADFTRIPPPTLTQHARTRMQQRGIRKADVAWVLRYGRRIHAKGADFYVVGHKDVARWASLGLQLSHLAGIQVLTSEAGTVITAYRSHNLHAIQVEPRRHRHSRSHRECRH